MSETVNPNPSERVDRASADTGGPSIQGGTASRAAGSPYAAEEFTAFNPTYKSPVRASVLSVIPGLGQIYVGYYAQGFVNAAVVLCLFTIGGLDVLGDATPVAILFALFFWLFNIIDAGRRAAFFNAAMRGGAQVKLPGQLPSLQGGQSILGGFVLLLGGGVLLSNTALGFSLVWLEQWWPLLPMLIGAILLIRSVLARPQR